VLKIDTSTELENVWIDVDGIHRALWNVISNSLDATSNVEGAVVKVSLFQRDAVQFIRVEDQGIGIAKENLERIFVAFFSDKGGGGTGLGLAVSRKILREHNGDLTVTSVLGEGSVFELSIPVIKPDSAVASLNAKSTGSLFETGIVPPR
jgi:signal transduction histidine kinase